MPHASFRKLKVGTSYAKEYQQLNQGIKGMSLLPDLLKALEDGEQTGETQCTLPGWRTSWGQNTLKGELEREHQLVIGGP